MSKWRLHKYLTGIFFIIVSTFSFGQSLSYDSQLKVALRQIGHELLLAGGDSLSTVAPISQENHVYRVSFTSGFAFLPDQLTSLSNSYLKDTGLAEAFLVEVKKCDSDTLIYSFQVQKKANKNLIPCLGRPQAYSCYELFFHLEGQETLKELGSEAAIKQTSTSSNKSSNYWLLAFVFFPIGMITAFVFMRKKRTVITQQETPVADHLIPIGRFVFDQRNMRLLIDSEENELTSKEADLLFLLHQHANKTLEREKILFEVWGDEGDYIGRTLDVFISKLRKKLAADEQIKIVNIRGVGYKFVVNDAQTN